MANKEHLRFVKYEGIGNDFVMIADPSNVIRLTADLVRKLCDRRFGIGADGVIRVAPGGPGADLFMDYVNSDGSIGEMCGNGIRCLALFAREMGMTARTELRVDTRAGVKRITVNQDGSVTVNMGPPIFEPSSIPVAWPGPDALHAKVELPDQVLEAACLSMGNSHAVVFVEDLEAVPVASLGPQVEHHPMFPKGANVEFVRVVSRNRIEMRVWERGSGQTLACGTGACAGAVAARLLRETGPSVTVALPGGELEVAWSGSAPADTAPAFMTGPATKVFEGDIGLS
jgi:diaminopimelate epimerase